MWMMQLLISHSIEINELSITNNEAILTIESDGILSIRGSTIIVDGKINITTGAQMSLLADESLIQGSGLINAGSFSIVNCSTVNTQFNVSFMTFHGIMNVGEYVIIHNPINLGGSTFYKKYAVESDISFYGKVNSGKQLVTFEDVFANFWSDFDLYKIYIGSSATVSTFRDVSIIDKIGSEINGDGMFDVENTLIIVSTQVLEETSLTREILPFKFIHQLIHLR